MAVWIPDSVKSAHPTPIPTLASSAKVTTSGGTNPRAINAQNEPLNSVDQTSFFHWWPKKGTTEWVVYTFAQAQPVSEAKVYWFDDTGIGECRVPASWRILYKDGDDWKPVETEQTYGTDKDRYNTVGFKPVTTTQLKLEVVLKPGWSAGIQQWRVK
jgi:hypothetical protein